MAEPDVTMKRILGVNDTSPPNENTGYYLDHVAIEVDMSDVESLDRGPEGLPINVEGHFKVREDENPASPIRRVHKAHRLHRDVGGGGGGIASVPSRTNSGKPARTACCPGAESAITPA